MHNFQIRWMTKDDITEVLNLENEYKNDGNKFIWKHKDIDRVKSKPYAGSIVVCGNDNKPIAYLSYELQSNDILINRIIVSKNNRRIGIGRQLINELRNKCGQKYNIKTFIPETNKEATLFFHKCRFFAKLIPNYFDGEDAYEFIYESN